MAITIIGVAGADFQRGIADDESGINIEEITCDVKPEYREDLKDKVNVRIATAVAPPEVEVSIKGEISDATAFPATDFVTPATIANTTAYMGATGYDYFATNLNVTQGRAAWFNMTQKLIGSSGLVAA